MADLWLYADPHYGHDRIRAYCHRPFDNVHDMDEAQLTYYNELVKPGDDVFIFGDFAFRNHNRYLARLPGKKTFVYGNHDKMAEDVLRNFSRVVGDRKCPGVVEFAVGPYSVTGSHFPMASWNASHHGSWHVHGHTHGRLSEPEDMLRCDIGVDVWGFKPVNFELVRRKLTARIPAWKARQERMARMYEDGFRDNGFLVNKGAADALTAEWLRELEAGTLDKSDYHVRYSKYKKQLIGMLNDKPRTRSEPEPESSNEPGRDDSHTGIRR